MSSKPMSSRRFLLCKKTINNAHVRCGRGVITAEGTKPRIPGLNEYAQSVNVSGETVVIEPAIVDTDVLIDVGRDVEEAVASLEQIEQRSSPTISVVMQMEP